MQPAPAPLGDPDIAELDELLARIPAPFEPMDACAVDGYLCGVLLQPVTISSGAWLPLVFDLDGRAVPQDATTARIRSLVLQRHAELQRAISQRQWFDPWIFEADEPGTAPAQAQLPWVAGFAAAQERFPALTALDHPALLEPLAVLYAPFDADDLEDADALLAVIETLEPPATMDEAAEDLVRSVLLLADVSSPGTAPPRRTSASRGESRRGPGAAPDGGSGRGRGRGPSRGRPGAGPGRGRPR